jgi:hypothetical protein
MDDTNRESRIARMAQRHGLRLMASTRPVGYILINGNNVVEFGASAGPHRASLGEIENYLNTRVTGIAGERRVRPRRRPRWMKVASWP